MPVNSAYSGIEYVQIGQLSMNNLDAIPQYLLGVTKLVSALPYSSRYFSGRNGESMLQIEEICVNAGGNEV